MLHAIIMAGGSGTRFWPASRAACPKQLLNLTGTQTMLQATVSRLGDLVTPERVLVVTNERLVDPIVQQLPQLPPNGVIGEPCKRDTAPCVGLAALLVTRNDPDATMVVLPADHVIKPDSRFQEAIRHAAALVEATPKRLVTFGIRPTYPAETYGYIERDDSLSPESGTFPFKTYQVACFHEKPKGETATRYYESGNFDWNAGIFVWKARTILDALAQHEPAMHARLETIAQAMDTPNFSEVFQTEFAAIEGKSIDYAIMERSDDVVMVEAPFDWDDLGNWQSLARLRGTDEQGNTIVAEKHLGIDTQGTIVRAADGHLVVTAGLKDCIVVHTPDATSVANRNDEESLRQVVKYLEKQGWSEFL